MTFYLLNEQECASRLPLTAALADSLRDEFLLKGTKIACREGDCGACTVLIGRKKNNKVRYRSAVSCILPIYRAQDTHIVTIDMIAEVPKQPLFQFFEQTCASQCGYCSPGFIMAIIGALLNLENITAKGIESYLDGNICRCTGYQAIKDAISLIAAFVEKDTSNLDRPEKLVHLGILPASFLEAMAKLKEYNDLLSFRKEDTQIQIIAGGSDLLVQKPLDLQMQEFESRRIFYEQKKAVAEISGKVSVRANCTIEEVRESDLLLKIFPNLADDLRLFASTPIRNIATVAGNIVNGSPIADMVAIFLALRSEVELINSAEEKRIVPLSTFYKGYKKNVLKTGEWLNRVLFPIPNTGSQLFFEKIAKRRILDIASVNSAALIQVRSGIIIDANISAGGVYATPLLLQKTSDFLCGKELNAQVILQACARSKTEIRPISDARGSKVYKEILLGHLIRAHFQKLGVSIPLSNTDSFVNDFVS